MDEQETLYMYPINGDPTQTDNYGNPIYDYGDSVSPVDTRPSYDGSGLAITNPTAKGSATTQTKFGTYANPAVKINPLWYIVGAGALLFFIIKK